MEVSEVESVIMEGGEWMTFMGGSWDWVDSHGMEGIWMASWKRMDDGHGRELGWMTVMGGSWDWVTLCEGKDG